MFFGGDSDSIMSIQVKVTKTTAKLFLVGTALTLAVAGCTYKQGAVEAPVELPAVFSQTGSNEQPDKWWLAFKDPELNTLVERALKDNFSLKASWEKLNQVRAVYLKSRSGMFPTLDGEAGAARTVNKNGGSRVETDKLILGLSAQYEVDLWGEIDSTIEAARLDVNASAADLETAAMTVAASVARSWYGLVAQDLSIRILEKQIEINSKGLELIMAQFRTGQVPMADVLQQRQLIESKIGERVKLEAEKKQSQHQLEILTGRTPGENSYQVPDQLTLLPPLPSTGIPSELILSRPDVRSAFHNLEAADARIAVAVADRFPALRLSLSLETSGSSAGDIFNNYLSSVAASLVGPIFDGGRRKAEVDRTRAVAAENLNKYAQTILTAVQEVEDALVVEKQQLLYLESLQAQLNYAQKTMAQVKERYLKGVENYQRILTALISLQGLEQSILNANRDLLLNRIQLCRALGGGWGYGLPKNES